MHKVPTNLTELIYIVFRKVTLGKVLSVLVIALFIYLGFVIQQTVTGEDIFIKLENSVKIMKELESLTPTEKNQEFIDRAYSDLNELNKIYWSDFIFDFRVAPYIGAFYSLLFWGLVYILFAEQKQFDKHILIGVAFMLGLTVFVTLHYALYLPKRNPFMFSIIFNVLAIIYFGNWVYRSREEVEKRKSLNVIPMNKKDKSKELNNA